METDIETKYCQSCGMPLDIEGITEYGTNSDGTLNQEFCSCCLNSGKYLFNFSMEYLIYLWWKIQCKLPPKTKRFCPLVLE